MRITVLMGGTSTERDVSLATGVRVAEALRARGHEVRFWAQEGSHAARESRKAGLQTLEIGKPWVSLPRLRSALAGVPP